MQTDALALFHPAVARWFRESFHAPTPPQVEGWPRIAAGEHTLICSPTGSGKTLAAFLYAIDEASRARQSGVKSEGVHTLYISPLKSLANDIERNLRQPLEGIRHCAAAMGEPFREILVGVRTGDTPPNERQRMLRTPPDLLITTPESMHLLLTSIRAREMLRTVRYVIVDEIHALCSDKRGTFLCLLLERLEALSGTSAVRIGLSATQRPLEEVARFLGGFDASGTPRPISVVDSGMRKSLDLEVLTPMADMTELPQEDGKAPSAWPALYDRLLELIEAHESTLIFANSRRVTERIAAALNQRAGHDFVRAHHGSVSKEQRLRIEQELKEGVLPALVATSSMELGIDVGAIDLVCQVESPFSVASGLQRVGRAGHLVRATSKGRLLPKTRSDLLTMAAMTHAMLRGDISAVSIPRRPLDVLAQQVIAMVSMDDWDIRDLYDRVCCAYPYRKLAWESFERVLDLVSGAYRAPDVSALKPRVSWDRATGMLYPMPGSRRLSVLNGGTIPDTGQFPMVLEDGKTRIGELDEEFVFERRVGETFVLGTGQYRVLDITHDRVVVAAVDESEAMMPFWKGEGLGHDAEFGRKFGAFIRMCIERLDHGTLETWLQEESALSQDAARNVASLLSAQRDQGKAIPTDRVLVADVFPNEAGDERLAILSPFGRSFHLALQLALQGCWRERGQELPEAVFSNAGILLRPGPRGARALIDDLTALPPARIRQLVLDELENSPYFAMRFRRNAGRALLLPRSRPGKRTPLWLQRLRSHELLSYASQHPNFPIVLETYREILDDELPLVELERFVRSLASGEAEIAVCSGRGPSPFSAMLLLDFTGRYLYEEDRPVRRGRSMADVRSGLTPLLEDGSRVSELLDEEAIRATEQRLQGLSPWHRARNGTELVELLRRVGDLSREELEARCAPGARDSLDGLIEDGRIVRVVFPDGSPDVRWVAGEDLPRYEDDTLENVEWIVKRYMGHHAYRTRGDILQRYPAAGAVLDGWRESDGVTRVVLADGMVAWTTPGVLAELRRRTIGRRRKRIHVVAPEMYVQSLIRRHGVDAPRPVAELPHVLEQLAGCRLPVPVWDDMLRARVRDYHRERLEELIRSGSIAWTGWREGRRAATIQLSPAAWELPHPQCPRDALSNTAERVLSALETRGALFLHQLASAIGEAPSRVAATLWELTWSGWASSDSLQPAFLGKPIPSQWERARSKHGWGGGRWFVARFDPADSEERLKKRLNILLERYGLATREIAKVDALGIPWKDTYGLLTRMEWAGEVERAYFVSGLGSPQFARRWLIDSLHARRSEESACILQVSDPVCVFGELIGTMRQDGTRYVVRRHPGNYAVLVGGRPVLAVEQRARRLVPLAELSPSQLHCALETLAMLVVDRTQPASIRVEQYDGVSVLGSPAEATLSTLGFSREDQGMVRYREF